MTVITDVRITPVAFADPPLLNVWGVHQPYVIRAIIEVELSGGIVGLGETYGDSDVLSALRLSAPALIGQAVENTAAALGAVRATLLAGGAQGAGEMVAGFAALLEQKVTGAFEVALLDALGKHRDLRVCDLLGGAVRDRVQFCGYLFYKFGRHIDLPDRPDVFGEVLTPEALVRQARIIAERHGFRSFKLKGGALDPAEEIAGLRALRAAFPDHPLRFDPNAGWTMDTTEAHLPALVGLVEYLEDPVLGVEAMGALQRRLALPLSTNMCVKDFADIPAALRNGGPKIILADHHYWGGLRASVELGRICESQGFGLSMHSNSHLGISLMAMVHCAAAVPALSYPCDTHYAFATEEVVAGGRIAFAEGAVAVPDRPGLGVDLDEAALAALARQFEDCGIRDRDDAGEMRKYRPGWQPQMPRF